MAHTNFRYSIFRRTTIASIAIALLSVFALYAVTYLILTDAQERSLSSMVDTDIAGLVDIYASGGQDELVTRIKDRTALQSQGGRQAHYLLSDKKGVVFAGNIKKWPELSPKLSEQGYVNLVTGLPVFARATLLNQDLRLLVAREYEQDQLVINRIGWIFFAVGASIIALVAAVARWAALRLSRRVNRINKAYRASETGAFLVLPDQEFANDEIGELARHSAKNLKRLANLVTTNRHVSDHVAHEIRTPLMHLDNRLVDTLKVVEVEAALKTLSDARNDIRGITAMLDSLLDIAVSEARKGENVGLTNVDLSQLLTYIVELYIGRMEDCGLNFETKISPAISMQAEEMQIIRMISNLLDNAVKYVPSGGTVTMSLEQGPIIKISDDGPGIAEDLRANIFERFRRGANAGQASGHGLGLALAKAIAERHNLTMQLADGDKGCCFVIAPEGRT